MVYWAIGWRRPCFPVLKLKKSFPFQILRCKRPGCRQADEARRNNAEIGPTGG